MPREEQDGLETVVSEGTSSDGKIKSFVDFFPHYLQEHSKKATRAFHLAATSIGYLSIIASTAATVATGNADYAYIGIPSGIGGGYLLAWISHMTIEKNMPATFKQPIFSLYSDMHMHALWLTGNLGKTLDKHGIKPKRT